MRPRVCTSVREETHLEALVHLHRTSSGFSYTRPFWLVSPGYIDLNALRRIAETLPNGTVAFRFAEYAIGERHDESTGSIATLSAVMTGSSGWFYPSGKAGEVLAMGVAEAREHPAVKDKIALEELVRGVPIIRINKDGKKDLASTGFSDFVVVARNGDLFRYVLGRDRLI